jgi:uncharacterized protein with FMN-binding domain
MDAFNGTLMGYYLIGFLALAAIALALAVGVVAPAMVRTTVRNRRTRLARRQTMRTYYGRMALHH